MYYAQNGNTIVDSGTREQAQENPMIRLEVQSDTYEYDVVVNGVECDFCGMKEHPDMIHNFESGQSICESCFEHYH